MARTVGVVRTCFANCAKEGKVNGLLVVQGLRVPLRLPKSFRFGSPWTMERPVHAVHNLCQALNEEVNSENVRFDFIMHNDAKYGLAVRFKHKYASKFYNTYLIRITDLKQPIKRVFVPRLGPAHLPPSASDNEQSGSLSEWASRSETYVPSNFFPF